MTTLETSDRPRKWLVTVRALLGFVGGLSAWWYGYYWAGRLYAHVLGYDPFFEYASMQFASSVAGGIAGSVVCGLILWHKKLFPVLVAILAASVIAGQFVLQSRYGFSVNYIAIVIGFSLMPLLVMLFDWRERKSARSPER